MNRHNNFDFLRFVAATLVLFSHCYPLVGRGIEEPVQRWTRLDTGGSFAVALFFVLSGYLITASYLNTGHAVQYLFKRLLRLFPALAVAVLLSVFVLGPWLTTLPLAVYFDSPLIGLYLENLYLSISYHLPGLFVNNPLPHAVNGSLWTLPVEFLMYLVVLVLGLVRGLKPWSLAATVVACWVLCFWVLPDPTGARTVYLQIIDAELAAKLGAYFFTGGLLYVVRERFQPRGVHALAAVLLMALGALTGKGAAAMMLGLPIVVMYLAFLPTKTLHGFGKQGDFSYGMYIYAFPIQQAVVHWMGGAISPITLFVLSFVPTLLLSVVSWKWVEQPALRLKRRFAP